MTTPPLPDVPCVRVRLVYQGQGSLLAGSRFYLSYSGSAPAGSDCTTLAGDIAADWNTNLSGMINPNYALIEVDVIDIATTSGASGQWTGTHAGTRSGTQSPDQVATNVEFGIAERYRGGKPRMFLPPPVTSDQATGATWTTGFVSTVNTNVANFFTAVTGHSVGSMGTLKHVDLSYYHGFTNIANSSGRVRAVPTYRATALHRDVKSYSTKIEMSSQKRRRVSTTP